MPPPPPAPGAPPRRTPSCPALGSGWLAEQRVPPGSLNGDQGVAFDQPLVLEPVIPPDGGVAAPAGIGAWRRLRHQPGDLIGVAGDLEVVDGGLGQVVGL